MFVRFVQKRRSRDTERERERESDIVLSGRRISYTRWHVVAHGFVRIHTHNLYIVHSEASSFNCVPHKHTDKIENTHEEQQR